MVPLLFISLLYLVLTTLLLLNL